MAEVVSREKDLDKEVIFKAIEAALATATRKRHPDDIDVRVSIHRDTGEYDTYRVWEVVNDEDFEFPDRQIRLSEAKESDQDIEAQDQIEELMGKVDFGRIAAQAAKQVIMQKVREAEREQVAERYKDRVGMLISGTVKRTDRGHTVVDLGDAEAVLPKNEMIPREGLRPGDRIKALLKVIDLEARGPQLILSRISPQFLVELFKLEVPEAGEGIIEILAAARDPGSRAKIAVRTHDSNVDPVGACVGIRGSRVQSVSNEIAGERVDIVVWPEDEDIPRVAMNALSPAEVEHIMVDEDKRIMDVAVTEENLSRAIGRGGQNVRLASDLIGWELNLLPYKDAIEKQEAEYKALTEKFLGLLPIDENTANILVQEGYSSLEDIVYTPKQEMLAIEEFEEELVDQLRMKAKMHLLDADIAELMSKGPEDDLLNMEGMDGDTARALSNGGIRTMENLADCAVDEVLDIVNIDRERASALIMTARAPWFEN